MDTWSHLENSKSVQVFMRIRPLTATEVKEKHEHLCYKNIDCSTKITLPSTKKTFGPFTKIFQEDHNNQHIFQEAIRHSVGDILNGDTICCFCHGHTGSGKTHTIMGYGSEYGLYDLSSLDLWTLINSYNSSETKERKKLKLQIRFAEQYNDKVYDLLNNKEECFVRVDSNGVVQIRSLTSMDEKGRVKVGGLKPEFALNHEDVIEIVKRGINNRTIGSSSIHDQSSRSHSILEFQIVNQNVQELTTSLLEAEATLVPIGKKKDDTFILIQSKGFRKDEQGNWVAVPNAISSEDQNLLKELEDQFSEAERAIATIKMQLQEEMKSYSNITLGGTFVFIDLAGAEYVNDPINKGSTRTGKELKEGQYINESLLALKECIRSIYLKKQHVPFRNSKLTQILRDYLLGKNAKTLMIGTMSSSNLHEVHAKNTLHYAELVANLDK